LNLFPILIIKLISGLLSNGHYRSFPSAATILFMQKKFIELWTNQKQTGDIALVQSKGTKAIYSWFSLSRTWL